MQKDSIDIHAAGEGKRAFGKSGGGDSVQLDACGGSAGAGAVFEGKPRGKAAGDYCKNHGAESCGGFDLRLVNHKKTGELCLFF